MSTCWEIKGSLSKMERRPATYRTRVLAIRKHLRKFPTQLEPLCVWCHTLERSYLRLLAMTKKEVSSAEKSIKPTDSSFLLLSLPTGYPLSSMMEETLVHLETQYTVITNVRWETSGLCDVCGDQEGLCQGQVCSDTQCPPHVKRSHCRSERLKSWEHKSL